MLRAMVEGVHGIEHLGLTVPDLDEATSYFEQAFGARVVCDVLDQPVSGPELATALGVPDGSVVLQVRLLRLGHGPNLELFHYDGVPQRDVQRACDLGLQHFSVLVDDLDATLARCIAAGGHALSEPGSMPGGLSGDGNRWVNVAAPWGTVTELIELPGRQAYEPVTHLRLWRPDGPSRPPVL